MTKKFEIGRINRNIFPGARLGSITPGSALALYGPVLRFRTGTGIESPKLEEIS